MTSGQVSPHSNSHIVQMSRFTPWPFSSPLPQLSKSSSGSFRPKGRLSTSRAMRQEPWVAGRLQKGLHSRGALARPSLRLLGEHSSLFTIKLCVQVRRPSAGASAPAQPRLPGPAAPSIHPRQLSQPSFSKALLSELAWTAAIHQMHPSNPPSSPQATEGFHCLPFPKQFNCFYGLLWMG